MSRTDDDARCGAQTDQPDTESPTAPPGLKTALDLQRVFFFGFYAQTGFIENKTFLNSVFVENISRYFIYIETFALSFF